MRIPRIPSTTHLPLLLLLVFALAPASIFAAPPRLLYRADTRPPYGESGPFRTGFRSWGNNRDLRAHELGYSCGTGDVAAWATADSAFVSVARSLEQARQFAELSFEDPRPPIWIYTIRATPQFYDAAATVAQAGRSRDPAVRDRASQVIIAMGEAIAGEGEYISAGIIDASLVRDATRYEWNAGSGRYDAVADSLMTNANYVDDPESHANAAPLDPQVAFAEPIEADQVNRLVSVGRSIFSACSCLSGPSSSARRFEPPRDSNDYCKPMLQDRNATSMINVHLFN